MSQQTELQGFLSIKIPPKMRGFLPWKTWKRQWISIRCLPAGGIDLIVGRNSQNILHLSPTDIIVRTQSRSHLYAFGIYSREGVTANFCLAGTSETESQKWISTLRKLLRPPLLPVEEDEFAVSIIDNNFTRSSGFPGLYGILRVNNSGLTITDPSTSKITAHWFWRQLSRLYMASAFNKEDSGRVCTIITSREFPTGAGKIRIFCTEALSLIRRLSLGKNSNCIKMYLPKRSVPYRHHTFSYDYRDKEPNNARISWIHSKRRTSLSDPAKYERRLSKSEGNLFSLFDQLDQSSECSDSGFIQDIYNNLFSACFSDNEDKINTDSNSLPGFHKTGPRITEDLATVSETKASDFLHVYQELGSEIDDDCHVNPGRLRKWLPRRQSGASVASGVYEEIDELSFSFTCSLNTVQENTSDSPPPLPPRRDSFNKRLKSNTYQSASTLQLPNFQNKFISRSAGNTPLPSPPSLSRTASSTEFFSVPWQKEDESHYLPMNSYTRCSVNYPKNNNNPPEEQHYVDMSGFADEQS